MVREVTSFCHWEGKEEQKTPLQMEKGLSKFSNSYGVKSLDPDKAVVCMRIMPLSLCFHLLSFEISFSADWTETQEQWNCSEAGVEVVSEGLQSLQIHSVFVGGSNKLHHRYNFKKNHEVKHGWRMLNINCERKTNGDCNTAFTERMMNTISTQT